LTFDLIYSILTRYLMILRYLSQETSITYELSVCYVSMSKQLIRFCLLAIGLLLIGLYFKFPSLDPSQLWTDFTATPLSGYETVFNNFRRGPSLLIFIPYAVTTLLGFVVLRPFTFKIRASHLLKIAASFIVGYPLAQGIIRMVALITPHDQIFLPSFAILAILGLGLLLFDREPAVTAENPTIFRSVTRELLVFSVLAALLGLFLVESVHKGIHDWTGHGSVHYADFLSKTRDTNARNQFPIISQHYGEVLFNYSLYTIKNFQGNFQILFQPVLLFWITNALGKVSAIALLYLLLVRLNLSRLFAAIAAAFLFFGTSSLNLTKYYLLFDSFNPLYFVLHPDRVLGVLFVLLVLTHVVTDDVRERKYEKSRTIFFLLAGLGLPASPIQNFLMLFFIMVTLFLFQSCLSYDSSSALNRAGITPPSFVKKIVYWAGIGCLVVPPFFVYGYREPVPGLLLMVGMSAAIIFLVVLLYSIWKSRQKRNESALPSNLPKLITLFILPGTVSVLYLGNVLTEKLIIFSKTFEWLKGHGLLKDLVRLKSLSWNEPLLAAGKIEFFKNAKTFDDAVHKLWSEYDKGGLYFVAYYGLMYFFSVIALALLNRNERVAHPNTESYHCNRMLAWSLIMCLSLLSLFFFYADFVTDTNAWVKSRFLEIPFYTALFIFLYSIGTLRSRLVKAGFGILLMAHMILPIIYTHRISQWQLNLKFLSDHFH